ncbi:CDK2-associated and cullin domain-containing protein 1-like isoform X2 [Asterias amurensis]|uniref:CDK2-associated and cullin domain-containing protein 1-like isoform X2 n=1 Tax=Asterias amurensis TaxID=7602 RepID=UPI003AB477BF
MENIHEEDHGKQSKKTHGPESNGESTLLQSTYGNAVMTDDDYVACYWMQLDKAVRQLLYQQPGVSIRISYEQMYSCVYKCVCQQYSERMYKDLRRLITAYLQDKFIYLQMCTGTEFLKQFHSVLKQYTVALGGIVPIFTFLNRFYITQKLRTELRPELEKLFLQHLNTTIYHALVQLHEAQEKPFSVDPSIASDIVHGLFSFNPDYADLHPGLFAKYIPSILPPCLIENIPDYIKESHEMRIQLLSHQEFNRNNQCQRKRCNDAETTMKR